VKALLQRTLERLRPPEGAASAEQAPVVIFGTGGSGTRVLQILADRAGYFMGANLNAPGDSLEVGQFTKRWVDRYLTESNWIDEMWRGSDRGTFGSPSEMAKDFRAAIERHRAGLQDADAPWGWKFPRTILMLPFVHETYPAMKAVHLVRDGRDMAFSRNQNQVRAKGRQVLSEADLEERQPVQSIKFWSRVNVAAARYGTRFVNDNYLRFRYEDVCSDPGEAVVQLLDFLDCGTSRESMRAVAAEVVKPSASTRRRSGSRPSWMEKKEKNPVLAKKVQRAGADALRELGYL
jgi:hypothetical protein